MVVGAAVVVVCGSQSFSEKSPDEAASVSSAVGLGQLQPFGHSIDKNQVEPSYSHVQLELTQSSKVVVVVGSAQGYWPYPKSSQQHCSAQPVAVSTPSTQQK